MFKVLFITFSGIGIGYLVRRASWVHLLPKSISYTIWLLLFIFGLQVGANDLVVSNLNTLGLKALNIALAGCLGSSVAAWLVWKYLVRRKRMAGGDTGIGDIMPFKEISELAGNPDVGGPLVMEETEAVGKDVGNSSSGDKFKGLMAGIVVVAFFAVGCICGWQGFLPDVLHNGDISMYVLYLLMVQVGMGIGSDRQLKAILMSLKPQLLLLPLATVFGTLLFVAVASPSVDGLNFADTLAVGAGFGYYSLSSVLITQIKEPVLGSALAAQIGTVALMSNIMREIITLLFSPLICRLFGKLAPISSGGATSMDSTLPVITAVCGKDMVFISIFHGVLVDFSVPFLVTFFASI